MIDTWSIRGSVYSDENEEGGAGIFAGKPAIPSRTCVSLLACSSTFVLRQSQDLLFELLDFNIREELLKKRIETCKNTNPYGTSNLSRICPEPPKRDPNLVS
ncbi:hypothetical protein F2Q69_00060476 [Brassica cretica]|uniref:Uncharacterized protein n=1 Tax=Brassica cretica TaxID=69181 RepID=A0A8S9RGD9_BRACR|nr:hypothetical protein F2Q69_00060476 [Brassica cretica]